MNIRVTCRHMDVTDALRNNAIEEVSEGLKVFTRIDDVHVILDVEKKLHHIAELVITGKNHIHVEAKAVTEDMYHSITAVVEKAVRQLRKSRDKVVAHKGQPSLGEMDAKA